MAIPVVPRMRPRDVLAGTIKVYRRFVSPLLPPSCRYWPTCSEYALQAVLKYGVLKGVFMGAWRVSRCNPWSKGGVDPVR